MFKCAGVIFVTLNGRKHWRITMWTLLSMQLLALRRLKLRSSISQWCFKQSEKSFVDQSMFFLWWRRVVLMTAIYNFCKHGRAISPSSNILSLVLRTRHGWNVFWFFSGNQGLDRLWGFSTVICWKMRILTRLSSRFLLLTAWRLSGGTLPVLKIISNFSLMEDARLLRQWDHGGARALDSMVGFASLKSVKTFWRNILHDTPTESDSHGLCWNKDCFVTSSTLQRHLWLLEWLILQTGFFPSTVLVSAYLV